MKAFDVLFEDNHLLAINKPVGLPTMGVAEGKPSVYSLAKQYLKQKYAKPGNVYLGIVSRLDAMTSGVLLLARTSKAAARLSEQFRTQAVDKVYWAIVEGNIPESGELVDWLTKDEREWRIEVAAPDSAGAREARLTFRRLKQLQGGALVEVHPLTGRKHQIRVQLANHGFPVLGDAKYGSGEKFPAGIALHARQLTLEHPVTHAALELTAPLPEAWRKSGVREA